MNELIKTNDEIAKVQEMVTVEVHEYIDRVLVEENSEISEKESGVIELTLGTEDNVGTLEENNVDIEKEISHVDEDTISVSVIVEEQGCRIVDLPDITGKESNVILAHVDDRYSINMQITRNSGNVHCGGLVIFLTDRQTGRSYINNENELVISKMKLMCSPNYHVMNVLSVFDVNITENIKKMAYERAKMYIESVSVSGTELGDGMTIGEACEAIVQYALYQYDRRKKEDLDEEEKSRFYYDGGKNLVGVRVDQFQKVLDILDTGFKKSIFGKKVRLEEARIGRKILISNKGREGYAFNTAGNIAYYMFDMESVLSQNGGMKS